MNHHCLNCGTLLTRKRVVDDDYREICPACGWIYYPQLNVGAGILIERDGKILLLQRAHDPYKDDWNLPAGFVDIAESPLQAAEREALEETSLQVRVSNLINVYWFNDDPRGNGLLILYACEYIAGELHDSAESHTARYFAPSEIPTNLAGGGHDQAILSWKTRSLSPQK